MSEKLASLKKVGGGGYNTLIIDNNGGDFDSLSARTFDMKVYLPNDYQKLTLDNFSLVDVSQESRYGTGSTGMYSSLLASYDASAGLLTTNILYTYISEYMNYGLFVTYKIKVTY